MFMTTGLLPSSPEPKFHLFRIRERFTRRKDMKHKKRQIQKDDRVEKLITTYTCAHALRHGKLPSVSLLFAYIPLCSLVVSSPHSDTPFTDPADQENHRTYSCLCGLPRSGQKSFRGWQNSSPGSARGFRVCQRFNCCQEW